MTKKSKYPAKIYVKREDDDNHPYLIACEEPGDLLDQGQISGGAAEYQLVDPHIVIERTITVRSVK